MHVTKNKIKQLQSGKKIHDGRGLYFFKKGDKGRWSFRYQRDGRCHEMGCGPYPEISIPMAREKRESYKKMLSCGLDPITEKRKEAIKRKWQVTSISLNKPKKERFLKNVKYLQCNFAQVSRALFICSKLFL